MNAALQELLEQLDLETIEVNIFRGVSPVERSMRVYGGHVMAQALMAASRTVSDDRSCHSYHSYFLLGGDPKAPILYNVERTRDGGSFTTRRVVAIQHGRPIFHMEASFHVTEKGWEHQFEPPAVAGPDELETEEQRREAILSQLSERAQARIRPHFLRERPFDTRPVEPFNEVKPDKRPPYKNIWVKPNGELPDDLKLHQCMLAYISDMSLLDTAMLPHGVAWFSGRIMSASLDHAMWFHHPFRMDDWMLYTHDSPVSAGGRGFNRGLIYTRDGKLVSSVVQEGLIRQIERKPRPPEGESKPAE